jgi:MoxR-like ATPase
MNPAEEKPARAVSAPSAQTHSILAGLGIIGMESIEPAILGALIGGEPLLLIGPHGTGKSYLLNRISVGLGLQWRHYNASLLNYDDLVGFPLPGKNGALEYVQTPASIWGAEAVFIDEISRCRPDLQNKLFPIIHERRVQGILLDRLVYRWSAMNPPSRGDEDDDAGYRGSEPLDEALADRFAFVIEMPPWERFSDAQQEQVILAAEAEVPEEASRRLRSLTVSGRSLLPAVREDLSTRLAAYVRILAGLLLQGGVSISPRRAGMILRNILTVHSARLAHSAAADPGESAWLALPHSLPHLATGGKVNPAKILAAHREAWKIARMDGADPRRIVLLERDPLVRALRAARIDSLKPAELSTIVADSLASLPAGARHALAAAIFESGAAGRLVAAVAEQCAALYALAATPQDVRESVAAKSTRHVVWQRLVGGLAGLDGKHPDTPMTTNLFAGLFAAGEIDSEEDLARTWDAWHEARKRVVEMA